MKFLKLKSCLVYKRIDENTYEVKDCSTGDEYELGTNVVAFMNKLDGKTDPFEVNQQMSIADTEETLEFLLKNKLVKTKLLEKERLLSYSLPLFKIKATKKSRLVCRILNYILLVSFLPIAVLGLLKFNTDGIASASDSGYLTVFFGIFTGLFIGTVLHEAGHAFSGIGYNFHMFNFGIMIGFPLGAYVEMSGEHIKSRLKVAQSSMAGIEMNLLLAGTASLLTNVFVNHCEFLLYIVISNIGLACINLLPVSGFDGWQTISNLIDTEFFLYAYELLTDKKFITEALKDRTSGVMKILVCILGLVPYITFPLLVILSISFGIREFGGF